MACGTQADNTLPTDRLRRQIRTLAVRLARTELRPGFTPSDWHALGLLAGMAPDDTTSVTGLARRAGLTKSAASRSILKLVEAGLVERSFLEDDRRVHVIAITPLGRESHGRADATPNGTRDVFEQLSASDRTTLARILDQCLSIDSGRI